MIYPIAPRVSTTRRHVARDLASTDPGRRVFAEPSNITISRAEPSNDRRPLAGTVATPEVTATNSERLTCRSRRRVATAAQRGSGMVSCVVASPRPWPINSRPDDQAHCAHLARKCRAAHRNPSTTKSCRRFAANRCTASSQRVCRTSPRRGARCWSFHHFRSVVCARPRSAHTHQSPGSSDRRSRRRPRASCR